MILKSKRTSSVLLTHTFSFLAKLIETLGWWDELRDTLHLLSWSGFQPSSSRSTCLGFFCLNVVLRNISKITGKHVCWSLLFNKVARLGSLWNYKWKQKKTCGEILFLREFSSQEWRFIIFQRGVLSYKTKYLQQRESTWYIHPGFYIYMRFSD